MNFIKLTKEAKKILNKGTENGKTHTSALSAYNHMMEAARQLRHFNRTKDVVGLWVNDLD